MGRRTVLTVAALAAGGLLVLVDARPSVSSGTAVLTFRATLATDSATGACPSSAAPDSDCRARTGKGSVSGLGSVSATYVWFFGSGSACPSALVKPLATTGRFVVAGKGTIDFAIAEGHQCVDVEPVRNEPQEFTITGGTGRYQGATGQGRIERSLSGGHGVEWWDGTLDVPGVDFDIASPVITGAVSRTIKVSANARRARVTFKPRANDAIEGPVGVVCKPASGSFFKVGRTAVTCTASDTSGNTRAVRFTVTVRR